MSRQKKYKYVLTSFLLMCVFFSGCSSISGKDNDGLSGSIIIDGSSTVFPITEAVAEEFRVNNPNVRINIGFSGTGGGFNKFGSGEIDIVNASRPIKENEKEVTEANEVGFEEIEIAYDGIVVVVNKDNDFIESITVEELNRIWKQDSTVKTWKDVRSEWPDQEISLYAPGTDSGTFDYFTEIINGKSGNVRRDFTPSEDDNVLVNGVAGDHYSLSFFGYAYYLENINNLKAVKVDNGEGSVFPDENTIRNGSYAPLSRPLFVYVSHEALVEEHVRQFLNFYLTEAVPLVTEIGFVPLEDSTYEEQLKKTKIFNNEL